jgi:hypothetical protein
LDPKDVREWLADEKHDAAFSCMDVARREFVRALAAQMTIRECGPPGTGDMSRWTEAMNNAVEVSRLLVEVEKQ